MSVLHPTTPTTEPEPVVAYGVVHSKPEVHTEQPRDYGPKHGEEEAVEAEPLPPLDIADEPED